MSGRAGKGGGASLPLFVVLLLAACNDPLPLSRFANAGPQLDPIRFFTGHVHSWGVLEDRRGQPTSIVTTDCNGEAEGADALHMVQHLRVDDDPETTRDWHVHRTAPGRYEATANDVVGTAVGEAAGPAFHWRWTLALSPGNALKNVDMDQWWYLQADGSLINRTTVRKLGFIAAELTEHFVPQR